MFLLFLAVWPRMYHLVSPCILSATKWGRCQLDLNMNKTAQSDIFSITVLLVKYIDIPMLTKEKKDKDILKTHFFNQMRWRSRWQLPCLMTWVWSPGPSGRRELMTASCPLTSTQAQAHEYTHIHTHKSKCSLKDPLYSLKPMPQAFPPTSSPLHSTWSRTTGYLIDQLRHLLPHEAMFSDCSEPRGNYKKYHHHLCDHHHSSPSKSERDNPSRRKSWAYSASSSRWLLTVSFSEIWGHRAIVTKPQKSSLNKPLPPFTPDTPPVFLFCILSLASQPAPLKAPNRSLNAIVP